MNLRDFNIFKNKKSLKNNSNTFVQLFKSSQPKPVINLDKKLAVFFSAKSGCTFIVKWFFFQIQHLSVALDYHHFIHNYRDDVYMRSSQYERSKADFVKNKGNGYLKIKVVRNPFERAVSSYMHFLGMIKTHHKEINNNFGIGFEKLDYSFSNFLNLLSEIDINACNVHWNQQFQVIERKLNFDYVIDLKDSIHILPEIEKKHHLPKTENLETLAFSGHHSKTDTKLVEYQFCGTTPFTFEIRQNRPPYKCFYNAELEKKVSQIYKEDFEKYKFDTKYL